MGWLMATVYDGFMEATERACLGDWRADLLRDAHGRVLEIGAGTGANIGHYSNAVEELVMLEPDDHMRERLLAKLAAEGRGKPFRTVGGSAADLPFDDHSFDTVVSTLVLCSVPNLHQSLLEVHRVLRPGGRFLFLEHVAAAEGTSRRRWQRRLEPLWRRVAEGCHLTRETESAIELAGLVHENTRRESMRKSIPLVRLTVRGRAVKPLARA